MQRNRSILDSFPETIDLNQGSVSSNASGDRTAPWDNLLNPVEDRLMNSMLSSAREDLRRANGISYTMQNCNAWDQGELSSSANLHGIGHASHLKIGHGWPSSSSNYVLTNPKSEARRFGPSNVLHPESSTSGYGGNHLIPNLASAHSPVNAKLSGLYNNGDTRLVMRPSVSPTVSTSCSRLDAERPASGVSYNADTSSGGSSYWSGSPDISSSSMGRRVSPCKRKVLEGSCGQSCGRSSSSNAQPENIIPDNIPSQYDASSSLNISSASASVQNTHHLENRYPRNRVGTRVAASDILPPLNASGVAETSARNSGSGRNLGNHDTVTFGLLSTGTDFGHSSVDSTLVTGPISVSNYLGSRQPMSQPMSAGNSGSHYGVMHISGVPSGSHPVPWNVSPNSRGGSSSSPNVVSADQYAALQDGAYFRSSIRNNGESLPSVLPPETGNMIQDPTNWSLATSNGSYSRNMPSSSALSHGPSMQTFPTASAWTPYQNVPTNSNRSSSEISPWTLLPPVVSESGSQRGHFPLLSSAASPVEEAEISLRSSSRRSSSRRNHRNHLISSLMADFPSNDVDGWRVLASDIEGRDRLVQEIHQVLQAMQRGENRRSEVKY